MKEFWLSWRADLRTPLPLVVWVLVTVTMALAGPFGTYDTFPFLHRIGFWACIVALGIVVGSGVRSFVHVILKLKSFLVGSVLIAFILGLSLPAAALMVVPGTLGLPPAHVPGFAELFLFVFCTSLCVGAYRHTLGQRFAPPPEPALPAAPAAEPEAVQPRLLRRLPEDLRGRLIALSVRDHYVDVITDRGQGSLLMRLSDAVAETDGVDGAQVHRSHWVAWAAVTDLDRSGGKLALVMQDGRRVPVSRTYRDRVEARGIGMARAT